MMLVSNMIEHTLTLGDGKHGEEINDRALDISGSHSTWMLHARAVARALAGVLAE